MNKCRLCWTICTLIFFVSLCNKVKANYAKVPFEAENKSKDVFITEDEMTSTKFQSEVAFNQCSDDDDKRNETVQTASDRGVDCELPDFHVTSAINLTFM